MKYRIAIQSITLQHFKHEHNIMIETNNIDRVIKKITTCIQKEIEQRELKRQNEHKSKR